MVEVELEDEAWARDAINAVAFEVVSYLSTLRHVRDVRVSARRGVSSQQVLNWERVSDPRTLL